MKSKYGGVGALLGLIAIGAAGLSGCAAIVNVDEPEDRATVVNLSVAEYANKSMLLNILRAKDRAPLSFTELAQVQGHNTLSGSLGLPTLNFGPHLHTSPRAFALGPNTVSRSFTTDFTLNAVDDPATYNALFTPVSPATIGLFAQQGYPRELLFLLFVDHIRIKSGAGRWVTYNNDPTLGSYYDFLHILYDLIYAGVTIDTKNISPQTTTVTSTPAKILSSVCIDSSFGSEKPSKVDEYLNPRQKYEFDGDQPKIDPLTKEKISKSESKTFKSQDVKIESDLKDFWNSRDTVGALPAPFSCASFEKASTGHAQDQGNALEIVLNIPRGDSPTAAQQPVTAVAVAAAPQPGKDAGPKKTGAADTGGDGGSTEAGETDSGDTLTFGDTLKLQFVFRSAYGAYLFLGELAGGKNSIHYNIPAFTTESNAPAELPKGRYLADDKNIQESVKTNTFFQLNRIDKSSPPKCFVKSEYGGDVWCVDDESKDTKIIFSVLHQLVRLNSTSASQPANTISSRPVG